MIESAEIPAQVGLRLEAWKGKLFGLLWPALLRLVPVLALLAASVLVYSSSGDDDAHITYWASYSLAYHHGIYNYNGEAVEQSSSLLQVLLLAMAARLTGADIVTLGKLSSILFGALTILAVYTLAERVHPRAGFAAALLTAASAYFGYWTVGGMETTLTTFSGLLALLFAGDLLAQPQASRRAWVGLGASMLAFLLSRPETPLVLAGVLVGAGGWVVIFQPRARSGALPRLLLMLGLALLLSLAIAAFRWAYFGSPMPQPVIAKSVHLSLDTLARGAVYLERNFIDLGKTAAIGGAALLAGALLSALRLARAKQPQPHLLLMLAFTGVYLAFVIGSGGDWMEGGRFIAVLIPTAAALFAVAAAHFSPSRGVMELAVLGLLLVQVKTITHVTAYVSSGMPAWEQLHFQDEALFAPYSYFERQNRHLVKDIPLEAALKDWVAQIAALKGPQEPVILHSGQMGFLPYHLMQDWYGQVRIYDRFALAERSFTECPLTCDLPRFATGLQLDYDYLFVHQTEIQSQCGVPRPDLIVDIRRSDMEIVSQAGYTVVYFIYGQVPGAQGPAQGRKVLADEFIAVRSDWLARLDAVQTQQVQFSSLLLQE